MCKLLKLNNMYKITCSRVFGFNVLSKSSWNIGMSIKAVSSLHSFGHPLLNSQFVSGFFQFLVNIITGRYGGYSESLVFLS